ncbi:MAG TPA: hypothetical protein VF516_41690 [Kofleriaceae bacterium]
MARSVRGDLQPLPAGVDLNLAMRRSVRVGTRSGLPVEGIGIFSDAGYPPTRRDLISDNDDLVAYCAGLARRAARRLASARHAT